MSNCLSVYSSQSSKAFELDTAYVWIEEKKILASYINIGYVAILLKERNEKKTKMLHHGCVEPLRKRDVRLL